MTIRLKMSPSLKLFDKSESGIKRVIEAYTKHLPKFGVEIVENGEDLHAVHAGTAPGGDIAHLHGLYWTNDYDAADWELKANANIVEELRQAKIITVPSPWVAETIQRDMRIDPCVLTHGIDANLWTPSKTHGKYVLWNKNRAADVCDPRPMVELAKLRPDIPFITTFKGESAKNVNNIKVSGVIDHKSMKTVIENSLVYLSTTKETFGIGILEALAAGVPVLGFDWGGNSLLVDHGETGYLANPNDIEDLAVGLDWCIKYRNELGINARESAKKWTWVEAVERVADVYKIAMEQNPHAGEVSVIIPCYNYAKSLERAVNSVVNQTHTVDNIIIVDDGSTDNTEIIGRGLSDKYPQVSYYKKSNGGVATARNYGIAKTKSEFIVCLDADDEIADQFIEACITPLLLDRSIGITYTGLTTVHPDGRTELSQWPTEFNADEHVKPRGVGNLRGRNQIPTCCMFRRNGWERTGGYNQKFAPLGAGAEDAEFWTRLIHIGYDAKKVTTAGLFVYSYRTGAVSSDKIKDPSLREPYWLSGQPSSIDRLFPFASVATPKNEKSHLVRQYDEPIISVIIPVGPGHERHIKDAFNSLEGQSYRQWEVVVGWDSENEIPNDIVKAYPYVKWVVSDARLAGAGAARNRAVAKSRGSFLLFLDADDTIAPSFMESALSEWENQESVVYTDYYNKFTISSQSELKKFGKDVHWFNPKTKEVLVRGRSADYDCQRAQNKPYKKLYHWCLVTCLIPRAWHDEVGGFDESMKTFEDVLYHWKVAQKGYCYTRIEEPLVSYRMETGNRRAIADINTTEGKIVAQEMLSYCAEELEKETTMACKKCGQGKGRININLIEELTTAVESDIMKQQDENFVMIEYTSPNTGNHRVVGKATGTDYHYRSGGKGTKFLVHKADQVLQPHLFKVAHKNSLAPARQKEKLTSPSVNTQSRLQTEMSHSRLSPDTVQKPTVGIAMPSVDELTSEEYKSVQPSISSMDDEIDLSLLPGITPSISEEMVNLDIKTKNDILKLGVKGLVGIKGIGEAKAEMLIQVVSIDASKLQASQKASTIDL